MVIVRKKKNWIGNTRVEVKPLSSAIWRWLATFRDPDDASDYVKTLPPDFLEISAEQPTR